MTKQKKKAPLPEQTIIVHQYPSFIEWLGRLSEKVSSNKVVFFLSLSVALIAVISYFPTLADDYDIWFHLKYGEHFVRNLTWTIDHSQFSWTPSLPDWKYVTWIGSSILYLVYLAASGPGLYALQWFIFIAIGALLFYYIKSIGDLLDISHILGFLVLFVILKLTIVYLKPEIFSTLFFVVTLFIYFQAKTSSKNLFWFYPLLFLVWVNTHGGFIFGIFFVSLAMIGETANFLFFKKSSLGGKVLLSFCLSLILSYVALLINPYGLNYHIEILHNLFSKEYMAEAGKLFAYFSLWHYLAFTRNMLNFVNAAWSFILMAVLFIGVFLYAFLKTRHFDLTIILINVIFFFLGMSTARATMFFPLIWFFSCLYTLRKADGLAVKRKVGLITLSLLLVWSANLMLTFPYLEHRYWFGVNLDEYVPKKEVEFLKKHKLPGPIFNDYVIGAYMIWKLYPDYKVFIDPRYGPYVKQVLPDWFKIKNDMTPAGFQKLMAKYPVKVALLHMRELAMITWFLQNDWRLLYFHNAAVVLIDKSLIPYLSPEALGTDLGTHRFVDLKNPGILVNLFYFYTVIHPNYGREIRAIYEKNVSNWYAYKDIKLTAMGQDIAQKEAELKQKQLQLQQQQQTQKSKR